VTVPSPSHEKGALFLSTISVDGEALDTSYQVVSIETWFATNKVPRAQIVLFDGSAPKGDFPISNQATLVPGAKVEISAGYGDTQSALFSGIVVKHGIEINGTHGSKLCIDLADEAIKMTIARKNAAFEQLTDGELISQLIGASGLEADVATTSTKHEKIVQFYTTDWDLMVTRAEANGLVVAVVGGKVTVKAPAISEAALGVKYGDTILDLQAELDLAQQYTSDAIKSYAWDAATQALLDASPGAVDLTEAGNLSSADLAAKLGTASFPQQSGAPLTTEALTDWSSAALLRSKLAKLRGHVRFDGCALAEVGKTIELSGLGERFNGNVFIGGVHHLIHNNRWFTTVTFGLSPHLFATEARRIAAPDAAGQIPPIKGLHTGIVKQCAVDEAGDFRVLVTLPLLQAETGVWARLASFYASSSVGAVFFPEVDDEVILGFMNEDPRFPVILGSVYSQGRAPPSDATPAEENTKKAIVTQKQLKLVFDDKEKPALELSTPGGHSIKLDDEAGSITLTDSNQNTITLSKDGITLESAKDIKISAKGDVSIEAAGVKVTAKGDVSIEGSNLSNEARVKFSANGASTEVTASAELTVRGALVKIN
jgi:Rhs element Vgr protein